MTWRLDPPIRAGHRLFAAVTWADVSVRKAGRVIVSTGNKGPRIILMMDGYRVTALDLDGRELAPNDTERAYPEAVAQLRAVAGKNPNGFNDPDQ